MGDPSAGVRLLGRHVVTVEPSGGSRLTLQLERADRLSGATALLGRKTRRYVDLECARLDRVAAEASST
jgi:hypothetical protein